jgi:hypothetical protein
VLGLNHGLTLSQLLPRVAVQEHDQDAAERRSGEDDENVLDQGGCADQEVKPGKRCPVPPGRTSRI